MNEKKYMFLGLIILILGLIAFGCGPSDSPVVENGDSDGEAIDETPDETVILSFGGIQSVEDAASRGMEKLAELALEKSGGTLEIQTFPASQLGDATSQLEAVFLGSQDMFIDAQSWMTQYVPEKSIEAMFFTFDDQDHYIRFIESDLHSELEEELLELTGARTISNNWFRLPRVMASKTPINSLDDLQGLKMRVPDIKGYMYSVQALGISPTQIPWGEVYLSLQQGVVDACEGPHDSMYTMKFYEPTGHITMTNHIRDNLAIWINEDIFQRLSDNQKNALIEAAVEAGDWYTQTVREEVSEFFAIMESEGTEFIEIDIQPLKELTMQAALELETAGEWRTGFYEAVQDLAQ